MVSIDEDLVPYLEDDDDDLTIADIQAEMPAVCKDAPWHIYVVLKDGNVRRCHPLDKTSLYQALHNGQTTKHYWDGKVYTITQFWPDHQSDEHSRDKELTTSWDHAWYDYRRELYDDILALYQEAYDRAKVTKKQRLEQQLDNSITFLRNRVNAQDEQIANLQRALEEANRRLDAQAADMKTLMLRLEGFIITEII